jgi:hypothetical protein
MKEDLENCVDGPQQNTGDLSSTAAKSTIAILIEFFLDEFSEDASGVGDWLAQGDGDPDQFLDRVYELREALASGVHHA